MASSIPPNKTLYVNNLNDKITKDELRTQLYALFTTYGKIIDIVALKGTKMKGQAFLVFADQAGATTAMRACEGMLFYDKPLHIAYAKTKSHATLSREDPDFVPPNAANASSIVQNGKRLREEDGVDGRQAKREKSSDDDSDEEMEIEDDEDDAPPKQETLSTPTSIPQPVQQPSPRLLCTNLPQEVTNDVLSVLFQQYQGFKTVQVTWSPQSNPDGTRVKMAQVLFDSADSATTAKEATDGFMLKKGWQMGVVYI
ncbi:RNA-binding domain-containing protein [Coprinellus micaceus]|uniref:RNA-binding domain-containing protein n=1 Tax=Coprinellus micaceus TaxID=71717 RepID=A0A4Y7T7S8_COPMI|nr:RNA-binding domain-containing protein [Coprinellus micaceus]